MQGSHTLDDTALLHDFLGACSAARFRPFPAVSPLHIRDRAARLLRQALLRDVFTTENTIGRLMGKRK